MVQWRGPQLLTGRSIPKAAGDSRGLQAQESCWERGSLPDVPQSSQQRAGILTLPPGRVAADAQGSSTRTGWEKARRPRGAGPAATALSDRSALRVINGPGGAAVSAPRPCRPASGRQPRRPPARPGLPGPAFLGSRGAPHATEPCGTSLMSGESAPGLTDGRSRGAGGCANAGPPSERPSTCA